MTDKKIVKKSKNKVYTIEELYKTSFAIFIDNIVICIANAAIACIMSFIFTITIIGIIGIPAIWGGYLNSMIKLVRGEKEDIGAFLKFGFNHWSSLLGATIFACLGIFVGTCFFIIPGLYLMVKWTFVSHYIVDGQKSMGDAFSSSSSLISNDNFWPIAIVFIINYAIGIVAAPLFIVAMPFTTLVFANYYVNLSQK